jgi:hypothetical protein
MLMNTILELEINRKVNIEMTSEKPNTIYMFYKHKIGIIIPLNEQIENFKTIVDEGFLSSLQDTPYLNEDMEKNPNDVHIFGREEMILKHKGNKQ